MTCKKIDTKSSKKDDEKESEKKIESGKNERKTKKTREFLY